MMHRKIKVPQASLVQNACLATYFLGTLLVSGYDLLWVKWVYLNRATLWKQHSAAEEFAGI